MILTQTTPAADLLAITARYPALGRFGFTQRAGRSQDDMLSDADAETFLRVCAWLHGMTALKHCNRHTTSYVLKHAAEDAIDSYVPNGVFIAAALHCGFTITRIAHSPNCYCNISQRDLQRAYDATEQRNASQENA